MQGTTDGAEAVPWLLRGRNGGFEVAGAVVLGGQGAHGSVAALVDSRVQCCVIGAILLLRPGGNAGAATLMLMGPWGNCRVAAMFLLGPQPG